MTELRVATLTLDLIKHSRSDPLWKLHSGPEITLHSFSRPLVYIKYFYVYKVRVQVRGICPGTA